MPAVLPFHGGIEDLSNGSLILSVVAAATYLFGLEQPRSWKLSLAKTVSVALLAVIAAYQNAPLLLIVGLGLSALGDFFLSRDGERNFLFGLGSFLTAHIAYIPLFYGIGGGVGALLSWKLVPALALIVLSLGMLSILMSRVDSAMRAPIVVYIGAILLMGLAALTTSNPLVIAGALAFMASDTILSWEKFVETGVSVRRRAMRVAVWVLYYVAQVLILLGFVL